MLGRTLGTGKHHRRRGPVWSEGVRHPPGGAMRRTIRACLAVVATATLSLVPYAGTAASHDVDGQILYGVQDPAQEDVVPFAVNPDGTHPEQVYALPMECPHWSPDGTRIASCGAPDGDTTTILTVDTGGTRFLPSVAPDMVTPCYVWSSDGSRLACEAW